MKTFILILLVIVVIALTMNTKQRGTENYRSFLVSMDTRSR